ncbi:tRNA (adenosine(37)-N6)-dimethylallyltransferase MiaA [candidate division KSB1 bacterium]|nr:tRNA (adenosine(37)-N6)-dimethylallyltransferase MiaA [candidate division KSB1 bacterium]
MADSSAHKVLFIIGPTAVGKTELSLRIAARLQSEIVSADSRQVYRFLDIGTAKPSPEERRRIPHHFIDIRLPDQYYSAGEYGREARDQINLLGAEGKSAIVVGGSGLYIRALVDGLFSPKISDPIIKEKWRQQIREQGIEAVFKILTKVDPVSAKRLHPNDVQRILRALEVWEHTGRPISDFRHGQEESAPFKAQFYALTRDRDKLYRRIDERVDKMVREGLLDEVDHLVRMGYGRELNALRTVGYQEVLDYFGTLLSYEDMIETIKRNTRRYAKRQLTWFRRDERIQWLDLEKMSERTIEQMLVDSLRDE